MDRQRPVLSLVATTDEAALRAHRTQRLHELAQAFIDAGDRTVDEAFSALMAYVEPTLGPVSLPQPDTEGAPHE